MKSYVWIVIANALIWGFVMIGCSLALKGTGAFREIQPILSMGSTASLVIVGLGFIIFKKERDRSSNPASDQ